jgi:hypothetical protein
LKGVSNLAKIYKRWIFKNEREKKKNCLIVIETLRIIFLSHISLIHAVQIFHHRIQNNRGSLLTITELCSFNSSLFRDVDTIQEFTDILVLNRDGLVNKGGWKKLVKRKRYILPERETLLRSFPSRIISSLISSFLMILTPSSISIFLESFSPKKFLISIFLPSFPTLTLMGKCA